MTTIVAGTSFLLPGNAAWRALDAGNPLDFAEYGAWPQALMASAAEAPVVMVLFLADLLGDEVAAYEARLEPFLAALDLRLEGATAPTLVAFSGYEPESPVRASRRPAPMAAALAALEAALYERAAQAPGLLLAPLDPLIGRIGTDKAFDGRNFYAARCRLSSAGLGVVAEALGTVLGRARKPARKVLVLDCDGTLWGGVLGEVGIGGVVLGLDGIGQAFRDFQLAAKRLAADGILLAISSKNDEDEVWALFERHPGMALARSDIAAWRIDWNDKAENIRAMAADLDLGLDAFVFWDDNPIEREKVRLMLPEVLVVEPAAAVTEWPAALRRLDALAIAAPTSEDRGKTRQYQARAAFLGDKAKGAVEADFLSSIAMRPTALALDETTLARAAQLVAKTNQFNLHTARHGAAELAALSAGGAIEAFLPRLADRYGDHGLIGFVLARLTEDAGVAHLDTFLMSCRVLGRHVEAWVLAELARRLQARGCQLLVGDFVPSGRNHMAASFLPDHAFIAEDAWPPSWRTRCAALLPPLEAGTRYALALEAATIPYQELFSHADAS
jgi:FkbH-like protein